MDVHCGNLATKVGVKHGLVYGGKRCYILRHIWKFSQALSPSLEVSQRHCWRDRPMWTCSYQIALLKWLAFIGPKRIYDPSWANHILTQIWTYNVLRRKGNNTCLLFYCLCFQFEVSIYSQDVVSKCTGGVLCTLNPAFLSVNILANFGIYKNYEIDISPVRHTLMCVCVCSSV